MSHASRVAVLAVAVGWGPAPALLAQIPVGQEPHHRVVFDDGRVRVLDVDIPGGDTAVEHVHTHDLLIVSVGAADTRTRTPGASWGAVRPRRPLGETSVIEYAGQPGAHAIENVGTDPYRLIAVENPKLGGWSHEPSRGASDGPPTVEARAFRAWTRRLSPGTAGESRAVALPTVLVVVTGALVVERAGREPARLSADAVRWTVVDAGVPYVVTPLVGEPGRAVEFVEVAVK